MAKIRKKTKKNLIKALILVAVFLIALIGYFAWSFINTEKEFTVYTSMEEPTLPVIYVQTETGQEINLMYGYQQEMGNEAASDLITVLPENRSLKIRIAEYGNVIAGISYEIRSLDQSHFIEKTEVSAYTSENGSTYAVLPIQNLISKDTQYLLRIQLDTGENSIKYYTKIIWTENDNANEMLSFASNFSEKTFDYNAARELAVYLESSEAADNSNLGEVGIDSNFSQLTWGDTQMRLATDLSVRLKQYSGIMGTVEVRYMAERENELNQTERFHVVDSFTLRKGTDRIYLMNYERRTNELFEGNKRLFSGRQIALGIAADGMLQAMQSDNSQYIAYKTDRELWSFDQRNKRAVNVFSFRSGEDDGVRANNDKHDIKVLSVEDNGDIDFVVFGYMNRGRHEGYNGLIYYRYNRDSDTISERFFIPIAKSYEKIKLELDQFCQKGSNDMFYLMQNNAITAIDLKSLEMMELVSNLSEGGYAVSSDQTKVAWIDGEPYQATSIKFMDVATGNTQTIAEEDGSYLSVIGFSGHDLLYGISDSNSEWVIGGRVKGLLMRKLKIVSEDLVVQKEYEREGHYIENVRIDENRIHLNLYQKGEADGSYTQVSSDTIICREETAVQNPLIGTTQSDTKRRIYYVQLNQEIKTTRSLRVSVPRSISYENAGQIELSRLNRRERGIQFYAYENGKLIASASNLTDAVNQCYEGFGWVTDENDMLLYNRTDRGSLRTIEQPETSASALMKQLEHFTESRILTEEQVAVLDGQGLTLQQVLYYVYQGIPVAAFENDGTYGTYRLIYAYDNFNIRLYDPFAESEETRVQVMGKEDAEQYFAALDNDFICALYYRG